MGDVPVFQGHHLIEQVALENSQLLQSLAKSGHFKLHGAANIINLPATPALAAQLGISPHSGGPLGAYSDGLLLALEELEQSPDGRLLLSRNPPPEAHAAAAERMAARVQGLSETLRVGILNGDLVTNTPEGMTPAEANAKVRTFFSDLDGYQRTHATQIAELRTLTPDELRWRGVTQSEANVKLALDAIDQPGSSTLSDRWGGRASLGTAIEEANQAGRLSITEATAARVRTAFNPEMPLTIARPAPAPTAPELAGNVARSGATEGAVAEAAVARGQLSGARVLGAAGVAAMAVDFAITGHRVAQLSAEGNEAGARSAGTHFVGRTVGGFGGGFLLGAGYGAVTGSWTGPGAVITGIAGGVVGGFLGEKWAEYQDKQAVYTQVDRSGNEWSRDPEDPTGTWSRDVRAPTPNGEFRDTRVVAGGRLVDELNYKAANDSYSLGLANLPKPENPFRISAQGENTPPREPFEVGREYVRNPQNGEWNLSIRELIDGRIPMDRSVAVSAERAGQLELESQRIIAQNAANTPEAIAARYQVAYNQFGWHDFAGIEPVPEVITNAQTKPQPLTASDGEAYTRGADGEWQRPAWFGGTNVAEGNIAEELNRTRQSMDVGVQELRSAAAVAYANPTPTELGLRGQVVWAYGQAGITRTKEQIDAAVAAVAQDHGRDMAEPMPYYLQVQTDGSLATMAGKDDERMEIRSVTTPEEIERVRAQGAATPDAPQPVPTTPATPNPPAAPDHAEVDRRHTMGPSPEDAGLVEQLRSSVAKLDERVGKPWDDNSDRLLASAYRLSTEAGFKPGDNVEAALNEGPDAGRLLLVMRSGAGASPDPAANRAHMSTQEALAAAPEQQYAAARNAQEEGRNQALAQAQEQQQEQLRQGPRMGA
jgi:hypothetical protein